MKKTVAVIGAGITGILAAYYLAKDGNTVVIYEAEKHAAMKTSFANGGQLSVSNSETWNTWGNVWRGMKWLFKKDAPLLIRMKPEWAKIKWISKFLYHTIKGSYKQETMASIGLGLLSREFYKNIIEEEKIEFDYAQSGLLHFYKDAKYFEKAIQATDIYRSANCEWDRLYPWQVSSIEPKLAPNERDIVGGIWTASDAVGDIHKFCIELLKVLVDKYDVKVFYDYKVDSLKHLAGVYDAVVVSNGVGSASLAKSIGDTLDVYPVKGYSITINNVPSHQLPKTALLDDQAKIVTSTLGNRFRVAGTAELTGENYDIPRERIQPLLDWVHTNFPNMDTSDYSMWTCLRPMTPNMTPIVKQSKKNPKVFYHTGHGHLGWTYSPATAAALKQLIMNT